MKAQTSNVTLLNLVFKFSIAFSFFFFIKKKPKKLIKPPINQTQKPKPSFFALINTNKICRLMCFSQNKDFII